MAMVGNLDIGSGATLDYFHNHIGGNFLENIIDPMIVMIRVYLLKDQCFAFL
jgi:hypothetical protein